MGPSQIESLISRIQRLKISKQAQYTLNPKLIFIVTGEVTESALNKARQNGVGLWLVKEGSIKEEILPKKLRGNENTIFYLHFDSYEHDFQLALLEFNKIKSKIDIVIKNYRKYRKADINTIAYTVKEQINKPIITVSDLRSYLQKQHNIKIGYTTKYPGVKSYYSIQKRTIMINKRIENSFEEVFCIAHEIGHLVLHSEIRFEKDGYFHYTQLPESVFNPTTGKYILENPKNFTEWQANYFATSLLFSKIVLFQCIRCFQYEIGIPYTKSGLIYDNGSYYSKVDKNYVLGQLRLTYKIPIGIIHNKLQEFGLLKYQQKTTVKRILQKQNKTNALDILM